MPKNTNLLISLLFILPACVDPEPEGNDDAAAATENATDDVADDGDAMCVPGQSIACTCSDGSMSAQTCASDGSGFGECACGVGDDDDDDDDATTGDDDDDDNATTGDDDDDDAPGDSGDTGVEVPTYEDVVFVF